MGRGDTVRAAVDPASAHCLPIHRVGFRQACVEVVVVEPVTVVTLVAFDAVEDPLGEAFRDEREHMPPDVPVTLIFNKCDLADAIPLPDTIAGPPRITISALTGKGIDTLRAHLKICMGYQTLDAGTVSARQRHIESLTRARRNVDEAHRQLQERRAGELVAEELRGAQQALNEITGEFTTDDLLGKIFSSFCIGK